MRRATAIILTCVAVSVSGCQQSEPKAEEVVKSACERAWDSASRTEDSREDFVLICEPKPFVALCVDGSPASSWYASEICRGAGGVRSWVRVPDA